MFSNLRLAHVWNGYLPEFQNFVQRLNFVGESQNLRRQRAIFTKYQASSFEVSEPPKLRFHTPSHSISLLDSLSFLPYLPTHTDLGRHLQLIGVKWK